MVIYELCLVTVDSNFESIEPLGTVKRWSNEDKDYISVPRPALIGSNNNSMSGTDQANRSSNFYLLTICPQYEVVLATFPVYYLEVSLYNSWLLYRITEKDCPFLEHVQSIVHCYLNLHQNDRRVFKAEEIMFINSHVAKRVDPAVRFDRKNYLLEPDPTKMCMAWQKVPNVEINYMITVPQPDNSLSDKFAIIVH